MAFQFLVLLVIQVALFVIGSLLAPKPDIEDARPADLGDFQFPTADESRAIPVIWGRVKIKGPNVIWYGDLFIEEITEEIKTGLFSSEDVVVGFEYSIGIDFLLCHGPIDGLVAIEVKDRELYGGPTVGGGGSTTGVTLSIDEPTFYGSRKEGGGIVGDLQVYDGVENQLPDTYLESVLGVGNVPGYVDVAHCVWRRGLIGESEQVPPWAFEVERFPDNLAAFGLTAGRNIVNVTESNPAEVLYEVLTDPIWGLDIDPSRIDEASFVAAAETLWTEGNGFAWLITSQVEAEKIVEEVLRQIDGVLYETSSGEFILKLARNDYSFGALPIFDETNLVGVDSFSRAAWKETQNNIEVTYTDRAKGYTSTAGRAQDLANARIQGGQNVYSKVSFPGVKDGVLARDLASRELRQLSFPIAKAVIRGDREFAQLRPGDVFRFSWARLGITDMIMRVASVNVGTITDGAAVVECFEDIFRLGTALFDEAQPTNWAPTDNTPVAAATEIVRDAPYWFMLTDSELQGLAGERALSFVARPNGPAIGYTQFADRGFGSGYEQSGQTRVGFTPTGTLTSAYANNTADIDATGFTFGSTTDAGRIPISVAAENIAQFGLGLILIQGATPAGDELVGYEGLTDNGNGTFTPTNVHRGLLDGEPKSHSMGARVWFLSVGVGASGLVAFGATESGVNFKHRTESTTRLLDLASASANALTFATRAQRPLIPGFFRVNSTRFPTTVGANDVTCTWEHRSRQDPLIRDQDETGVVAATDYDLPEIEYVLTFYDANGAPVQIRQVVVDDTSPPPTTGPAGGGSSFTSYVYPRAEIQSDAGAGSGAFTLRVDVQARYKSSATSNPPSLASRDTITRTFNVDLP